MIKKIIFIMLLVPTFLTGKIRDVFVSDNAQGIQDSINASSLYDTVMVHNGTYYAGEVSLYRGISMKESVTLMSANGAQSCTLSGFNSASACSSYHVIYCSNTDTFTLIKGFTIKDGNAKGANGEYRYGGGICCYDYASPTIDSCIITNNFAVCGGGIGFYYSSAPTIKNCIIKSNVATYGGGVGNHDFTYTPSLKNNIIKDNFADYGGGIYATQWYTTNLITRNTITNNSAKYNGAGIYMYHSTSTITNNIIAGNCANYGCGGGIFIDNYYSSSTKTKIKNCVIALNKSKRGSAVFNTNNGNTFIDSCFIVDNGDIAGTGTGTVYLTADADTTTTISYSNLYYNTLQSEVEIFNNTTFPISLKNNFWWDTTATEIAKHIEGQSTYTPGMYNFVPGAPGEPIPIDSIRNYDNTYSFIVDSLKNNPDTLYLRIYGQDRNIKFREAAVAIIKTNRYPTGIAIALLETDTNSGIYQGEAIVKTSDGNDTIRLDDIYNIVKTDTGCSIVTITANTDTSQKLLVFYKGAYGIEESSISDFRFQNVELKISKNPFIKSTIISYTIPPNNYSTSTLLTNVRLMLYDLSGRCVKTLVNEQKPSGLYSATLSAKDLSSGIYFAKLIVENLIITKKLVLMK
ncbi:MAG: T9SS type A sorting domain-containing protein [bacterium]|nr:T9SS type A sorting domain-containing protein [bacterium]